MPVLFIYGVSDKDAGLREEFTGNMISAVTNIKELNLSKTDVSCFFPKIHERSGEEIVIFVDGLFEKPERTEEIRNRLTREIVGITHEFYPEAKLIECFVRPFNPAQGFGSFKK